MEGDGLVSRSATLKQQPIRIKELHHTVLSQFSPNASCLLPLNAQIKEPIGDGISWNVEALPTFPLLDAGVLKHTERYFRVEIWFQTKKKRNGSLLLHLLSLRLLTGDRQGCFWLQFWEAVMMSFISYLTLGEYNKEIFQPMPN